MILSAVKLYTSSVASNIYFFALKSSNDNIIWLDILSYNL